MTDPRTIACLPMYDWPEIRAETDALWAAISARLQDHGIAAPARLDRTLVREQAWMAPDLALAQTCGLPFMRSLQGKVTLLGAPVYDLPYDPGDYCSLLVARANDKAETLEDFRGRRVAFNGSDSQSGYVALQCVVAPLAKDGLFFGGGIESGSHRQSVVAVAEERADIAAVDAVSWQLALDHEPLARHLKVVAETPLTPGLPFITCRSNGARREAMNLAIGQAIDGLAPTVRQGLHVKGYRPRDEGDYAVLRERLAAAEGAGYGSLS